MVSSLLEHEQITTTVAKAKAAQRLADQVINWGKLGRKQDWDRANSWLLNPSKTLRPLFTTLSQRYASRPGGYTRLHLAGNRQGDNAPLAVLELVDGPNDLKWENAARSVGREMAVRAKEGGAGPDGWWKLRGRVEGATGDAGLAELLDAPELDSMTRKNVGKALAFRRMAGVAAGEEGSSGTPPLTKFLDRAHHHYLSQLALFSISTSPVPSTTRIVRQLTSRLSPGNEERGPPRKVVTVPIEGRRARAGERTDGWAARMEDGLVGETERTREGGPISRAKGSKSRAARRAEAFSKSRSTVTEPTEQMVEEAEAEVAHEQRS